MTKSTSFAFQNAYISFSNSIIMISDGYPSGTHQYHDKQHKKRQFLGSNTLASQPSQNNRPPTQCLKKHTVHQNRISKSTQFVFSMVGGRKTVIPIFPSKMNAKHFQTCSLHHRPFVVHLVLDVSFFSHFFLS